MLISLPLEPILADERRIGVDASFISPERRRYLEAKYGFKAEELDQFLEDCWAFTDENPEEFVRRRHGELQREGLRNEAIYRRLAAEAAAGRFRSPDFSLRQLRRIIYG
jgi:hypothetical protein